MTTRSCGHNIYTSTRACGHNGGAECAPKPWCLAAPPSLVTWNTATSSRARCAVRQCARLCIVLCGNVRLVPAEQSGALAPFRGCGPKKQSISLLPTARRSFSFIDSCPPILLKPKPSSEFTNVTIVESSILSASRKVLPIKRKLCKKEAEI